MSTDDDLWEKIIFTLQYIINENPHLTEFSIIPTDELQAETNKSPVQCIENNLGVESWCINNIFKYAQNKILSNKKLRKEINCYLTGALLIQPDVTTFWNIKRTLLSKDQICLDVELRLCNLVLSFKSKCADAYAFRRWILKDKRGLNVINLNCVSNEFNVLHVAIRNTPNNYHAWNHRIWCFEHVLNSVSDDFLRSELDFSEKWICNHVSEHTGFHYRQYLICLFKERLLLPQNYIKTVDNFDYAYLRSILETKLPNRNNFYYQFISLLITELFTILSVLHQHYPGHESVWYHHRFVIYHLYKTFFEIYNINQTIRVQINHNNINVPTDSNILQCSLSTMKVNNSTLINDLKMSTLHLNVYEFEKNFYKKIQYIIEWKLNDSELLNRHKMWLNMCLSDLF